MTLKRERVGPLREVGAATPAREDEARAQAGLDRTDTVAAFQEAGGLMKEVIARPGKKMVLVGDDGAEEMLLNWYKIDFFEWDEDVGLTWGCDDLGSRRTAYAILRELMGKELRWSSTCRSAGSSPDA